jgi:hypothetical protein
MHFDQNDIRLFGQKEVNFLLGLYFIKILFRLVIFCLLCDSNEEI